MDLWGTLKTQTIADYVHPSWCPVAHTRMPQLHHASQPHFKDQVVRNFQALTAGPETKCGIHPSLGLPDYGLHTTNLVLFLDDNGLA